MAGEYPIVKKTVQISTQKYAELLAGDGLKCGSQILRLAKTDADRDAIFRLRFQIFNQELNEGLKENEATGLDQDAYDRYCDHLMIVQGERVVGTYRLLPGRQRPPSGFYSEEEFHLDGLGIDPNDAVELGRGCIDPEYRKQSTLMNLLFGLSVYMEIKSAKYLFGCGSLPLMSEDDAEATYEDLSKRGKIVDKFGVHPRATHDFKGDASRGTPQVPPLVEVYLAFGAQIIGRPAYDPAFGCYDLFVFIDKSQRTEWGIQILERFDRRIQGRNEQEQA
jgi:L-ornithine Nalpha-acyltransferase